MSAQVPWGDVLIRCEVCRRRDWARGGPGRADRVGVVDLGVALNHHSAARVGYWTPGSRDHIPNWAYGDLRVKCRRGHRINVKLDTLIEQAERALTIDRQEIFA
jgi:hypothetical protein